MGSVVSAGVGAVAGVCTCLTCACISNCCCKGKVDPKHARMAYCAQIVVVAIVALLLHEYGANSSLLRHATGMTKCGDVDTCFGNQMTYRLSFASALYFGIMLIASFFSEAIYLGYWAYKILLHFGLVVVSFFIGYDTFTHYASVAAVTSCFFLFVMVVVLLDFAYTLHETLLGKMAEKEKELGPGAGCCKNQWSWAYLGVSLGAWIGSFVCIVLMYHYSEHPRGSNEKCGSNIASLTITLLAGVALTLVSMYNCGNRGSKGLLPPSIIFLYSTWLVWSAVHANPRAECDPLDAGDGSSASTVIGLIITGVTIGWTTFRATESVPGAFAKGTSADKATPPPPGASGGPEPGTGSGKDDGARQRLLESTSGEAGDAEEGRAGEAASDAEDRHDSAVAAGEAAPGKPGPHRWVPLAVYGTCCLYMAMLLTNWSTDPANTHSRHSKANMWVQICTQWATILLYTWTLVAHRLCPGREF